MPCGTRESGVAVNKFKKKGNNFVCSVIPKIVHLACGGFFSVK